MPRTPSPLRYPGGKTSILPMVSSVIKNNDLERGHYVEPYAGGCGLALSLLFQGYVHELHLNDIDKSIWSFWDAVLNSTNELVGLIENTPVTIEEWHKQKNIQKESKNVSNLDLGFSTFFLNRTNRSGIILKAGVIGGLKQSGNYKLDCRFNKPKLIEKIRRIEKYKHRIHLYNQDAVKFMSSLDKTLPDNSIFCIDPPYYNKGSTLYTNFYQPKDHSELSYAVMKLKTPWVLTYDNANEIRELYKTLPQYNFHLNYSAAQKRIGTELFIASPKVRIIDGLGLEKAA